MDENKVKKEKSWESLISLITKHYIITGFVLYVLILVFIYYFNTEFLNNFFRPLEVISTALSFLIVKQISDIRKESYLKANSMNHQKRKIENQKIDFYKLYKKKENIITNIKNKCETFHDMKGEVSDLKNLDSFFSMFQSKIAVNIYDKKDIEKYEDSYNMFAKSIVVFSMSDKDYQGIKDEEKVEYYENNIELINDSIICIEQHFENDENILLKFASEIDKEMKKKEEEDAKAADNQDDESL